jgi:tRNA A-37 threonylcarbamoyl transferase component Bud32
MKRDMRTSAAVLEARPAAERALREWIGAAGTLAAYAAAHPAAVALQGRGTIHAVPSPLSGNGEWVVRHYHRGGALGPLLGDRYLRVGTPRPVREFALARALEARGVPTPRAVAAAVYPAGAFYRGDLVTERVQGAVDLAAVLFGAGSLPARNATPARPVDGVDVPASEAMAVAGTLIRQLHESGLVHPDLNLKNVLIEGRDPPRALVLDLDRGRLVGSVSRRARRRMLNRFWRSVAKWEDLTGRSLGPAMRAAFQAAYDEGAMAG